MGQHKERVTTREEGYFHISNSGLTFKLFEKEVSRLDKNDGPSVSWEVEIRLGAFGHGVSFRFPILADMAGYFANVFGRLHDRMEELRASGDYSTVNHESRFSEVSAVKPYTVNGFNLDDTLESEGYDNIRRERHGSRQNGIEHSYVKYSFEDSSAKEGEGSELEAKYWEREKRRQELLEPLASMPKRTRLNVQIMDAVFTLTWDNTWYNGPARGEAAKAKIGDFFEKNPDSFWIYTSGFTTEDRDLILDRLGVTDEALRARLLRKKA